MKHAILSAAITLLPLAAFCQDDLFSDTGKRKGLNFHPDHYIGVQINELTKQILSVNNSDITNDNPFLVTYQATDRKTGWGVRGGVGLLFSTAKTVVDPAPSGYSVKASKWLAQMRVGAEKTFNLAPRWSTGVGVDLVYRYQKQSIKEDAQFGGYNADSTSTTNMTGIGAMGWLRYGITKRIFIGTETSFYYLAGKTKYSISYFGGPTTDDVNEKSTEAKFNMPVVFYLYVKL